MSKTFVNLFQEAEKRAKELGSKYRDIGQNRDELFEFLDANEWFGMEIRKENKKFLVAPFEAMEPSLTTWLRTYGQTNEKKIAILLEMYQPVYPQTCSRFQCFIEERWLARSRNTLQLLDYLLNVMDKDISEYKDEELRVLLDSTKNILTSGTRELLMEFLRAGKVPLSSYRYMVTTDRKKTDRNVSAYTLEQFCVMAYCVFNEESWKENSMIEKAAESKEDANLWLFIALHFVCALRKTDMERLPVPNLPEVPERLRQRIRNGEFTDQEAKNISQEVMFRLKVKPQKPNKTKRYKNVPDLKLFIPESLLVPMGIIITLAISFREEGESFVLSITDLRKTEKFFGEKFAEAVEHKRFVTRRANKAYLQGIEETAVQEPGKPKGYMLAALARSHKGGIGCLPELTDIYLKDASFTGYKPEFILKEMFERGVFGFIPAILLDKYSEGVYGKMSVIKQTELIRKIGLNGRGIEEIARCSESVLIKSKRMIGDVLLADEPAEHIGMILQRIASGAAPSKQPEYFCLRIAVGDSCIRPDTASCIGCGYEIYTKASVHLLMKEYERLYAYSKSCMEEQGIRYKTMLEKGLFPVISEMVVQLGNICEEKDMKQILDLVERGMENAARISPGTV